MGVGPPGRAVSSGGSDRTEERRLGRAAVVPMPVPMKEQAGGGSRHLVRLLVRTLVRTLVLVLVLVGVV